jgi:hypothetical protein
VKLEKKLQPFIRKKPGHIEEGLTLTKKEFFPKSSNADYPLDYEYDSVIF